MLFNANKCNLTELTAKSASVALDARIPRALGIFDVLVALANQAFVRRFLAPGKLLPLRPPPLPFPTVLSVRQVPVSLWGWWVTAGLPEFTTYGNGLHLGAAGCQ